MFLLFLSQGLEGLVGSVLGSGQGVKVKEYPSPKKNIFGMQSMQIARILRCYLFCSVYVAVPSVLLLLIITRVAHRALNRIDDVMVPFKNLNSWFFVHSL